MSGYEVLTVGRVGVDIYPQQVGVGLEDVETFAKYLGGSATNVAVAAARYGRSTAVATGVGCDPFGRFVRRALRGYGVSDDLVIEVPDLPTPVTFCEIFPPDNFPIYFYRQPSAPDLQLSALPMDAVMGAGIFWGTVTGLCQEPSRSATLEAFAARARRPHTVLDLDWRPMFWPSADDARPHIADAMSHATVAVGNLEECFVAVGERDPSRAAAALRAWGVSLAVVKMGPDGVLAMSDEGTFVSPPMPVEVVNGLGAGDAFGGALCHGLLAGWEIPRILRFANAAGAIVAGRLSCSEAMPTAIEVEDFLAAHAD